MFKKLSLLFVLALPAFCQFSTQYNWPGNVNFQGAVLANTASKTVPVRSGPTDPSTCDSTLAEWFYNTTTQVVKICTSPNNWTQISGSGGSYTLLPATNSTLGGVKIGSTISVAEDGTITTNIPYASSTIPGLIKVGSGLSIDSGTGILSTSGGGSGSGTYSLTSGALTISKVAGLGGVTANTLVTVTSSNTVVTSTINTRGLGIAMSTVTNGSNVEVAVGGTVQCTADNNTTAGDIAIAGTAFAGYCRDSGTTDSTTISSNINIVGIFTTSTTVGSLATLHIIDPEGNGGNPRLMVGDSGSGGASGAVSAPAAGDAAEGKFWSASGGWLVPSFTSGMASQFGDCKVTRVTSSQVSIGPNNSTTNACIVNFGATNYRITSPSTVTVNDTTTGVLYAWIDNTGTVNVGYPGGTSVTCTNCTSVAATSFPNDVIELGTSTFTNGAFDISGVTDFRAIYDRNNISGGLGVSVSTSGTSTTVGVDNTIVPTYQTGTASPNNATCTQIGQLYVQSGSSYHYWACNNNGSEMAWYQVDGGSGNPAYTLPIGSASILGGFKVGTGLSVDAGTGILSANALGIASGSVLGGIKVGSGLNIDAGTGILSVAGGGGSGDPTVSTTHFCVWECNVTSGNSTGTMIAHRQNVYLFNAPYSMVVKTIGFYAATTDTGKGVAFGIYDTSGNVLAQCSVVIPGTSSPGECQFGTAYTMTAGTAYYFVYSTESTTATLEAVSGDVYNFLFNITDSTNGLIDQGWANTSSTGSGASMTLTNFASLTSGHTGMTQPWILFLN